MKDIYFQNYIFLCVFREISTHKRQVFFSIISISLIMCATMVASSLLLLSKKHMHDIVSSSKTHVLAFITSCGKKDCSVILKDQAENLEINGVQTVLINPSLIADIKTFNGVKDVSLYLGFRLKDTIQNQFFTIGGIDLTKKNILQTTMFDSSDIMLGTNLVVEDSLEKKILIHHSQSAIKRLTIKNKLLLADSVYSIVGILNPQARLVRSDIYMPLSQAARIIERRIHNPKNLHGIGNAVLVEVATSFDKPVVNAFLKRNGFFTETEPSIAVPLLIQVLNHPFSWMCITLFILFSTLLWTRSQISCVSQRQADLLLLRSMGWQKEWILAVFLLEYVVKILFGSFLGFILFLGFVSITHVLNDALQMQPGGFIFFRLPFIVTLILLASTIFVYYCFLMSLIPQNRKNSRSVLDVHTKKHI